MGNEHEMDRHDKEAQNSQCNWLRERGRERGREREQQVKAEQVKVVLVLLADVNTDVKAANTL